MERRTGSCESWPFTGEVREVRWHLQFIAWSRHQHSMNSLLHRSRSKIPTTSSNGVTSNKMLSLFRSGQHISRKIGCVSSAQRTGVLGNPWRRWNCRSHSLLQAIEGDGDRQSHKTGQNPASDEQRETASCENHPPKAEGSRDGAATASTLFAGLLSVRFPWISKLGKLPPHTALQEPQGHGVRCAELDRDRVSRLLEERTRTTIVRTREKYSDDRRNALVVDTCHEVLKFWKRVTTSQELFRLTTFKFRALFYKVCTTVGYLPQHFTSPVGKLSPNPTHLRFIPVPARSSIIKPGHNCQELEYHLRCFYAVLSWA